MAEGLSGLPEAALADNAAAPRRWAKTARVGAYGTDPIMPIFCGSQIDSAGQ